jgi:hypothetical protein
MKNSTKYIIFGGAIALIGGAYYFMFHKKDDNVEAKENGLDLDSVRQNLHLSIKKPNIQTFNR